MWLRRWSLWCRGCCRCRIGLSGRDVDCYCFLWTGTCQLTSIASVEVTYNVKAPGAAPTLTAMVCTDLLHVSQSYMLQLFDIPYLPMFPGPGAASCLLLNPTLLSSMTRTASAPSALTFTALDEFRICRVNTGCSSTPNACTHGSASLFSISASAATYEIRQHFTPF